MVCAVHQPNYIPYLGFFNKFKQSDVFVLYDTVQYSKNDFHNRNKIKTARGPRWLTIPVTVHLGQNINEALVADTNVVHSHLDALKTHYREAAFFKEIFPLVESVYRSMTPHRMVDMTIPLLRFLFTVIDPNKKVVLASELDFNKQLPATEALISICKILGADHYSAGAGAKEYMNEDIFRENNIQVMWQDFQHPTYPQLWGAFAPYMSVLDALFNVGPDGLKKLI